jgi:hypothetical protein
MNPFIKTSFAFIGLLLVGAAASAGPVELNACLSLFEVGSPANPVVISQGEFTDWGTRKQFRELSDGSREERVYKPSPNFVPQSGRWIPVRPARSVVRQGTYFLRKGQKMQFRELTDNTREEREFVNGPAAATAPWTTVGYKEGYQVPVRAQAPSRAAPADQSRVASAAVFSAISVKTLGSIKLLSLEGGQRLAIQIATVVHPTANRVQIGQSTFDAVSNKSLGPRRLMDLEEGQRLAIQIGSAFHPSTDPAKIAEAVMTSISTKTVGMPRFVTLEEGQRLAIQIGAAINPTADPQLISNAVFAAISLKTMSVVRLQSLEEGQRLAIQIGAAVNPGRNPALIVDAVFSAISVKGMTYSQFEQLDESQRLALQIAAAIR